MSKSRGNELPEPHQIHGEVQAIHSQDFRSLPRPAPLDPSAAAPCCVGEAVSRGCGCGLQAEKCALPEEKWQANDFMSFFCRRFGQIIPALPGLRAGREAGTHAGGPIAPPSRTGMHRRPRHRIASEAAGKEKRGPEGPRLHRLEAGISASRTGTSGAPSPCRISSVPPRASRGSGSRPPSGRRAAKVRAAAAPSRCRA